MRAISRLYRSGFGPDSLELLGVCLEYSRRPEPLNMEQRMLVSAKSVEVGGNKHLVVEAVDRVIQRDIMETYFNASIRE
jgi:hypothetical protein